MKLIEMAMLGAIARRQDWKHGNTEVKYNDLQLCEVYLYGNRIAVVNPYNNHVLNATLAGHDTSTTRSCLRALDVDVPALRYREGYISRRVRRHPRRKVEDLDI